MNFYAPTAPKILPVIRDLDHSYTHMIEELELQEVIEILDKTIADMPILTREIFICRWEKGYSKHILLLLSLSSSY